MADTIGTELKRPLLGGVIHSFINLFNVDKKFTKVNS